MVLNLDPAVIDQGSPIPAERRLWAAVLRQAVCDLGYHRSTLQHFTQLWFESDKREPGSFLWVCELLELDASRLRRRLFELADKKTQVRTVNPSPAEVVPTLPLPKLSPAGDLIRI
jgi:hypothetical protein